MGKLIAIDGLDGSGKGTQAALLAKRLEESGYAVRLLSFPQYDSPSSNLVKMYLGGEMGDDPDSVNCFAASSFYAMDRYVTFISDWKRDYDEGKIIVADRYTTANAIHQLTKLEKEKRDSFLSWLSEFEYKLLGIPSPDLTLFLEVPVEKSLSLIDSRARTKDIHENEGHLRRAFEAAQYVCEAWDWTRIACTEQGEMRTREEISEEIFLCVRPLLS